MNSIQTGRWPSPVDLRLSINLLPPPGGRVPGLSSGYAFSKESCCALHTAPLSLLLCLVPLLVFMRCSCELLSFSLLPWGALLCSGVASTFFLTFPHIYLAGKCVTKQNKKYRRVVRSDKHQIHFISLANIKSNTIIAWGLQPSSEKCIMSVKVMQINYSAAGKLASKQKQSA